jgi:GNAT superfamily N-acetyltransferase
LDKQIVYISDIDEERFGIRIAKSDKVTVDNLPKIVDFCRDNKVKMLIARCPANDFPAVHAIEREGFRLMDTLVYYSMDLTNTLIPSDTGRVTIRQVRSDEVDQVRAVAAKAFRGYFGHYHADERLDNSKCDEVYISWAVNTCTSRDFADEVLVAELKGTILGFATIRMNNSDESEGILSWVDPSTHKMGIYRSLVIHRMEWSLSKGARRMFVSTQIINIAVQKVWVRLGFEPNGGYYTFHKWFD